jgi:hypothetical protein
VQRGLGARRRAVVDRAAQVRAASVSDPTRAHRRSPPPAARRRRPTGADDRQQSQPSTSPESGSSRRGQCRECAGTFAPSYLPTARPSHHRHPRSLRMSQMAYAAEPEWWDCSDMCRQRRREYRRATVRIAAWWRPAITTSVRVTCGLVGPVVGPHARTHNPRIERPQLPPASTPTRLHQPHERPHQQPESPSVYTISRHEPCHAAATATRLRCARS